MSRRALPFYVVASAGAAACIWGSVAGCSESQSPYDKATGSDASAFVPPPNATQDGASPDRLALSTNVRFAHLSPSLEALDFCYRRSGTDQVVGPLLGRPDGGADAAAALDASEDADADAGPDASTGAGGLSALELTGYWTIEGSGNYRVDAVAAGSTSCSDPVVSAEVTLEAGRYATVVVLGRARADRSDAGADASGDAGLDASADGGAGSLTIAAFPDDLVVHPGKARVRFVHAALGDEVRDPIGALSIAAIDGTRSVTLAPRVEPGRAATATTDIDPRGYGAYAPIADPQGLRLDELSDAAARSWSSAQSSLGLRQDSIHSGFVVTNGMGLGIVWCDDTATGTSAACAWVAAQ